jgi:hypothetical protein
LAGITAGIDRDLKKTGGRRLRFCGDDVVTGLGKGRRRKGRELRRVRCPALLSHGMDKAGGGLQSSMAVPGDEAANETRKVDVTPD